MANIFDYLQWRGDLPITDGKLTDADAVILSRLSYLPFDGFVSSDFDSSVTIKSAAEKMLKSERFLSNILWKGDANLLKAVAENERFCDMKLSGYVNLVEDERQMQFSAILITLDERHIFVSFRGTDNTIIGWQEDFNMYCTFPLPSQLEALAYFRRAEAHFDGSFLLGGHSKGGNLAIYAASFCDSRLQGRIKAVYNLDGPGFDAKAMTESGFSEIKDKIFTYVPQSSVFGMMFEHEESYTIIKSTQKGFLQHDIYSWEIERASLVTLREMTNTSVFFDHTLTEFVGKLTNEERREFTEAIFNLLKDTEDKTFNEIADNWFKDTGLILKSMKHLDSDTRSLIAANLLRFIKCAGNNFSDINPLRKQNRKPKKEKKEKKEKKKISER